MNIAERTFAYTSADLEAKIDEAERQAAETQIRYSADDVFDRVLRIIHDRV